MNQSIIDNMTLMQRAAAPTPKFFKKLQLIGATMIAGTLGVFIGKNNHDQLSKLWKRCRYYRQQ